MQKRLFVAINLAMELKRELFGIQKEISNQLTEELAQAKVFKWVAMENLHLTLKFIGDIEDKQVPKIIESIEKIIENQKPFEIKTEKICYDNEKQCPRLIWLITEKNRNLEKLAKNFDEKKFSGHITLARVKEWVFKKIEAEERPSISQDFKAKIPIQSIELMESVLKRTGPEYKIIKSFNLKKYD